MFSLKPKYKMWRVFDQPIGTFVYFFVRYENFALYHNKRLLHADPCCRSVIKEFAHAFSCAKTWEVWRALKKLELLSAAPRATLTHFSCSPNFPRASITWYTHAKHEQILNFSAKLNLENLAQRMKSFQLFKLDSMKFCWKCYFQTGLLACQ